MRTRTSILAMLAVALTGCRRWVPVELKGTGETVVETPATESTVYQVTNGLMVPFTRQALADAVLSEGDDQVLEEETEVDLTLTLTAEDGTEVDAELWYRVYDPQLQRVGYEGGWSPIREGDLAAGETVSLSRSGLTWLCTKEHGAGGLFVEEGCPQGPWIRVWSPEPSASQTIRVTLHATATVVYNQRSIKEDPKPQPFDLGLALVEEDLWAW